MYGIRFREKRERSDIVYARMIGKVAVCVFRVWIGIKIKTVGKLTFVDLGFVKLGIEKNEIQEKTSDS